LLQQALALARAAQQPTLEIDVLSALGLDAVFACDYPQAQRFYDRLLPLVLAQEDRYGEAWAHYFLGLTAHAHGDVYEAQRLLEQALRHAHALRWRLGEDAVLHALGEVQDEGWGRHVAAEACFAQDLRLTQETGERHRVGFALAAMGRNALYQGDLHRAATLLDQALRMSREVTSRASAAMALRGQSLLAHFQGDDQRARLRAEEALDIAQTTGMRREERLALRLLGHAQLGLCKLLPAQVAYEQAGHLAEQLGFQHLSLETATDLAQAELARGNTAQAVARVAAIVPDFEQGTLVGLEEPVLAYLTCYRVLRAADDTRADVVLAAGHAFLQERAAQCSEERRSRFLSNVPAHRALLAAWRSRTRRVPRLRIVQAPSS
jgi:tetratricopeptide (TPR) repeat protein